MKNCLFFLLISFAAVGAWAQPAANPDVAVGQTASEQRRAELRSALKVRRERETRAADQTLDEAPANRHLSPQELRDLRQQLRQQRRDLNPDRQ